MKYCFVFLLFIALVSCADKETLQPVDQSPATTDFIIGATGGWGGSWAFKMEEGQLLRSVEDRWLGSPEQIADSVAFAPFAHDQAARLSELEADFPEAAFAEKPFKFDCREQAWDGQCTYVIRKLEDGTVQYWTRSEFDDESEVTDYLDQVSEVMYLFYE